MTNAASHPPQVPLPAGYRLAELDDVADRSAMTDIKRWAFAFDVPPEDEPHLVSALEPGRSIGVWHTTPNGEHLAAVHSSFAFQLQVPGGKHLPTSGLTMVGVHPGHRRRGLGRAMLHSHLRRSQQRGEIISVLNAAESGIYERYGYGIASHRASLRVGRGARLRPVPGSEELTVELDTLEAERHGPILESLHASVTRPGWITRDTPALRARHLIDLPSVHQDTERLRIAIVRTATGQPRGYALFRRKGNWGEENQPEGTVMVRDAVALDAAAARALWTALIDLDLMVAVEAATLAPDDALLGLLIELRGTNLRRHDDAWLRLLDVPTALRARSYAGPIDVVIKITDPLVPDNNGCWQVRGGPGGAEVTSTQEPAQLTIDVADLASAYLGATSLTALAAAGRVTEHVTGTLLPTAAAFTWPVAANTGWGF